MDRITRRASAELRSVPGVRDVGAHIGRAVSGDQAVGTGSGEMWVTMDDSADYDATLGSIRDVVGGYPGVRGRVLTYESERSRGVFGPSDDGVTVRVFGQDYGVLRREAERLRGVVAGVDGVRDPRVELPADEPTLEVKVDLAAARGHGILPATCGVRSRRSSSGLEVGSFFEQQKVFAVVVRGVPATAHSVDSVRDLLLDAPGGRHVRLGDVASVRVQPTPVDVRHDAVSRYVDVRAAVDGRGVGAVQRDVRRRLRDVAMPLEYHAQVIAESSDTRGGRHLPSLVVASVLGIFLLLQAAFASWRLAAVVLATLPVAVVGGLLVAVLDGGDLSLGELARPVRGVRRSRSAPGRPRPAPPGSSRSRTARDPTPCCAARASGSPRRADRGRHRARASCRWRCSATSPATRSPSRSPSSSWAGSSPRRCSPSCSRRPCTSTSAASRRRHRLRPSTVRAAPAAADLPN